MTAPTFSVLRSSLFDEAHAPSLAPLHAQACSILFARPSSAASRIAAIASECIAAVGAARETQHVAALGYIAQLDPARTPAFVEALEWLMRRQYFVPGRLLTFENDGVGLLGVALGILGIDDSRRSAALQWLSGILSRSNPAAMPSDWGTDLMNAAAQLAGVAPSRIGALPDDLMAALLDRGISNQKPNRERAWDLIAGPLLHADGATRAAVRVAALDWVLRTGANIGRDGHTTNDVANLLDGVTQRSMRRWPWEKQAKTTKSAVARWTVDNEYHVQSLLWAILSPIFPDLDDEEYLKSLGQKHPRADLVIPSLALVIEVKFMRPAMQPAQVIEEIAADASLYFAKGTPYQEMLAFVWDDAARTEEHAELKQGLLSLPRLSGATVLSRPSSMVRSTTVQKTSSKKRMAES